MKQNQYSPLSVAEMATSLFAANSENLTISDRNYIGWYECRYIATLGFNNWQCG
jgi:F0F1-type ATP synthase alpha subunit